MCVCVCVYLGEWEVGVCRWVFRGCLCLGARVRAFLYLHVFLSLEIITMLEGIKYQLLPKEGLSKQTNNADSNMRAERLQGLEQQGSAYNTHSDRTRRLQELDNQSDNSLLPFIPLLGNPSIPHLFAHSERMQNDLENPHLNTNLADHFMSPVTIEQPFITIIREVPRV